MAADNALIKRMLATREREVEVEPGRMLRVRRPDEAGMFVFSRGGTVDDYIATVVGWSGITEADLLGADIGVPDEVPFDADLARTALRDRILWVEKVAETVRDQITEHRRRKEDSAKN